MTIETASPATTGAVASVQQRSARSVPAGGVGDNARRQSDNRDRDKCPSQDALK